MKYLNIIIILVVIIATIGITAFIVSGEIKEAKGFCESLNRTYSFEDDSHLCDGKEIIKVRRIGSSEEYWRFKDISDMVVYP